MYFSVEKIKEDAVELLKEHQDNLFTLWKRQVISLQQKMKLSTALYLADWRVAIVIQHLQDSCKEYSLDKHQEAQIYFKALIEVTDLEGKQRAKNPSPIKYDWEKNPNGFIGGASFDEILIALSLCRKHKLITQKEQQALAWLVFTCDWRCGAIVKKEKVEQVVESKESDKRTKLSQSLKAMAAAATQEALLQQAIIKKSM